uniref:Uncharacterized protein n=1 Tax=Panagrolaimus davidi TaxID=227884 RepID=A0A914P7P5_9BILA
MNSRPSDKYRKIDSHFDELNRRSSRSCRTRPYHSKPRHDNPYHKNEIRISKRLLTSPQQNAVVKSIVTSPLTTIKPTTELNLEVFNPFHRRDEIKKDLEMKFNRIDKNKNISSFDAARQHYDAFSSHYDSLKKIKPDAMNQTVLENCIQMTKFLLYDLNTVIKKYESIHKKYDEHEKEIYNLKNRLEKQISGDLTTEPANTIVECEK